MQFTLAECCALWSRTIEFNIHIPTISETRTKLHILVVIPSSGEEVGAVRPTYVVFLDDNILQDLNWGALLCAQQLRSCNNAASKINDTLFVISLL